MPQNRKTPEQYQKMLMQTLSGLEQIYQDCDEYNLTIDGLRHNFEGVISYISSQIRNSKKASSGETNKSLASKLD